MLDKGVVRILVDTLLVGSLLILVPFAWLMRDGLGPDAVASSGMNAVARCFTTFYSGPIVLGLALLSVLCRRRHR